MRRLLRVAGLLLLVLAALSGAGAWYGWHTLRSSLPQLDGTRQLAGLASVVTVARDDLGIPTIRGNSRADVARVTGFVHAQDRYFQMDLARRRAAGELAALVGPRALPVDRDIRIHRFRAQAQRAYALLAPADRALLDAYVSGVNAGLTALDAKPFEYYLLRQEPRPWRGEDSLLVILSMFITLQDTNGEYESTAATMRELLPAPLVDFLLPKGTPWDTPILGGEFPMAPIPGPHVYDLRAPRSSRLPRVQPARREPRDRLDLGDWRLEVARGEGSIGSNNFAVSGALTADGRAIVANDMHLTIRVPNIWYRAMLEWPGHQLIGITLPGVPALVAGSNTHVAWGFTNTNADWSDIITLEIDPANANRYRTPDGWREFERHDEIIDVAGEEPQRETVRWTIWGPVMTPDFRRRQRAYRWVAHSAERLAGPMTPLEDARTVEEAFDSVNGLGTPGQNFLVADRDGRIGWSIYGSIPRRDWSGWLTPAEFPRVVDPPDGRLWTANARVVDGELLAKLGDGSYEIGSRARLIRNDLMARSRFSERDLLNIQLNTRADFLDRWRDLLLATLTPDAVARDPRRAEIRAIVEREWTGRADAASVAYRLVRDFRTRVTDEVIRHLLQGVTVADPSFDYRHERRLDEPIYRLASEQPAHLLAPEAGSWQQLLLAAADRADVSGNGNAPLREMTWGAANRTRYRHPLSAALPFGLGERWLDMPYTPLNGDRYTPNMHLGADGPSERMVVSPGHERDGIMHMPTGQSGHPLSPFYANAHAAWVKGEPTPFLPGPAVHTLRLAP